MTADPPPMQDGRPTPAVLRVDVFLLAGQFPGTAHTEALRNAVSYAVMAEEAGFDGVWIAEHHFLSYGVCPSAIALAGFLLASTRRIRVGTAACILSNRHPVALGEEAVLLDAVSGSRFDLGVGRGGPWIDLDVFGTGLDRYTHAFTETLDLLLAWLSGRESVGADGPRFRFPPVEVVPRPVGVVPVWVAATGSATTALAAARGLPLLLGMHADTAQKGGLLADYTAGGGSADAPHAAAHLAYVADTTAAARATLRATMPGWLATTAGYRRIDDSPPPDRDPHTYLNRLLDMHPVGNPQHCIARLHDAVAATGIRRLLLMVEGAGDPVATLENIHRLGSEVLPELRRRIDRPAAPVAV